MEADSRVGKGRNRKRSCLSRQTHTRSETKVKMGRKMDTHGHKVVNALRVRVKTAEEGRGAPLCAERRPQRDSKPELMIEANRDPG